MVDLLMLFVMVALLIAVVIMFYNALTNHDQKVTLQSQLITAAQKLATLSVTQGSFPASFSSTGIIPVNGTRFGYHPNGDGYCLSSTDGTVTYKVSNTDTVPSPGACDCLPGFILVPGNTLYGTSDFCIMKYEAKQGMNGVPVSQINGQPWTSISQEKAMSESRLVAACNGCHLMSNGEWMTIATDIASVGSNWNSGIVGLGSLYQGHVTSDPAAPLAAGYDNDGGAGETGTKQTRILTLSNGNMIWDFSGNVAEWTSGYISAGQMPGVVDSTSSGWHEWTDPQLVTHGFTGQISPAASGLSGSAKWGTTAGVGGIDSFYNASSDKAYVRGGSYSDGQWAGIWSLNLTYAPTDSSPAIGFRVAY